VLSPHYSVDKQPILELLTETKNLDIQLPDFQRSWVWSQDDVLSLLASVSLGYPIGTVLLLENGGQIEFATRPIEGIGESKNEKKPQKLILDGQQRLTALFGSLILTDGFKTVRTKPKREVWGRVFISLEKAMSSTDTREEAFEFVSLDGLVRGALGRTLLDLSSEQASYQHMYFPMNNALDHNTWFVGYMEHWKYDPEKITFFNEFANTVLYNIKSYPVPVVTLNKNVTREAVCQIFEKVNTSGVPLTIFELLTAVFATDTFRLRDDWDEKKQSLRSRGQKGVLYDFSDTDFLQCVTLLATYEAREAHIKTGRDVDSAPRIGCKREEMLNLSLEDYQRYAPALAANFERLSNFLHTEGIYERKFVPYGAQLIPLLVVLTVLGNEVENAEAKGKISKWLWCGILGELYGGSTESRFANDVPELIKWVRKQGDEPRTITESIFSASRLLTLRSRQSAAYKGLYALSLLDAPKDWLANTPINIALYDDQDVDIHHVFPKDWCKSMRIRRGRYNSILNKTPLSARTNRIIGGNAPSKYLTKLSEKNGLAINGQEFAYLVSSHGIELSNLLADDFEKFYEQRGRYFIQLIEARMQKEVRNDLGLDQAIDDDDDSDEDDTD